MSTNPPPVAHGAAALPGASPARLGRYEVIRRMAVGGMAEIYLARARGPEGFEKVVVVKRIQPRLSSSREVVTMFLDEARIAATLRHSNIVQVYDIGEEEGEFFFSMELLHGEDTGALMQALAQRERRLPLQHAVGIVANVCAGLHYAHEKVGRDGAPLGIVHRDVSPSNVFVTMDGEVKLLDFGVAKAAHRLSVTTGGLPKGKLPYMSPEQVHGEPLDRRSDIFSLAVLLWELSTSRRLLRGKSDYETMKAITDEDAPPPSVFLDDYPSELERIVMRGLARDRERRFQTAQELQLALEGFSREHRLAVSPIALAGQMKELFGVRRTSFLDTSPSAVLAAVAAGAPATEPGSAPGAEAVAVLGQAPPDPEQAPVRSPAALVAPGAVPATAVVPQPPAADAAMAADAGLAATQRLPKAELPPLVRGGSAARAPTQEIPAVTQQQLATAQRAAVSVQPPAAATGGFATAPRKVTKDLPAVAPAALVVAPAASVVVPAPPTVAPAAPVVTPEAAAAAPAPPAAAPAAPVAETTAPRTVTHAIRRRPLGLAFKVAVAVVAVLVLVVLALLGWRAGLFGTATPTAPPPAPKTVAAKVAAARAASKAAAAKAAAKTPAKAVSAKAGPARVAPPHAPSGAPVPHPGAHPPEPGHR